MADNDNVRRGVVRNRRLAQECLTLDERRVLMTLGSSSKAIGMALGASESTVRELMSPHGRARPSTVERIRAKLAELSVLA